MVHYKELVTEDAVYNALADFQECFPHLGEKVRDLRAYAQKLCMSANTYVLIKDEKQAGITSFYANDQVLHCAYISLIGIKQQFQKCQMGRALLNYSELKMKQQGMKKVRLEVDCDNINAQGFYRHMGFNIKEKASDNSWFMEKEF